MGTRGLIHSIESFGTVDGPGIRYVVFLKGCPMRCLYCHNPDTWTVDGAEEISAEEILADYRKKRDFYKKGGITVSGGEPLTQIDFLIELFSAAKKEGIHTCLDTSGIVFDPDDSALLEKFDLLISHTDLVMLDIKHIDAQKHKALTGRDNSRILAFARYLDSKGVEVWIRHVIVEGYTDSPDDLKALGKFLATLKHVKALDVLPYHAMGEAKYRELGISYTLEGMKPYPRDKAQKAKEHILSGLYEARKELMANKTTK